MAFIHHAHFCILFLIVSVCNHVQGIRQLKEISPPNYSNSGASAAPYFDFQATTRTKDEATGHSPSIGHSWHTQDEVKDHSPSIGHSLQTKDEATGHSPSIGHSLQAKDKVTDHSPGIGHSSQDNEVKDHNLSIGHPLYTENKVTDHSPGIGHSFHVEDEVMDHSPSIGHPVDNQPTDHSPSIGHPVDDQPTDHSPSIGHWFPQEEDHSPGIGHSFQPKQTSEPAVHSNSHKKVLEMTRQKTGGKNGIPSNEACGYRVDCGFANWLDGIRFLDAWGGGGKKPWAVGARNERREKRRISRLTPRAGKATEVCGFGGAQEWLESECAVMF
nr:DNA-directed RNA polymerase II subunit RPB1-like [Ipomoea batatas]